MDSIWTKVCKGNPGALKFVTLAEETTNPFEVYRLLKRMENLGIVGDKLYMLWNDCFLGFRCYRDVDLTLKTMREYSDEEIIKHINYECGRGIPFERGY